MKKLISALLAAAMLLSLAACGETEAAPTDNTDTYVFTDDLGREVTAPAHPERVAAMIGSFADVWCLAGAGTRSSPRRTTPGPPSTSVWPRTW